jgi:hypothetical protein
MRPFTPPLALLFASLPALGACGPSDVGGPCNRAGTSEDCVEGAICATDQSMEGSPSDPVWETHTCRAICDEQRDCPHGEECRGVTGASAVRACQPIRTRTSP